MINELNILTSSQCISKKLLRKKLFVLYSYSILSINIYIVKMFCVLHNKVALLTRNVLSGEQEIVTKEFLERFYLTIVHIHIENIDQKTRKLRLGFLFRDLSRHFRMYLVVKFFILSHLFLSSNQQVTQPQPKYKTINFPNLGSLSKNLSSRLADFGCLKVGGLGESIKKWKFVAKIFFQKLLD